MKKMCEAGIPVLDVYHISAAYPHGTIDGIHYPHFVFYPAEEALEKYFTTWLLSSRAIVIPILTYNASLQKAS